MLSRRRFLGVLAAAIVCPRRTTSPAPPVSLDIPALNLLNVPVVPLPIVNGAWDEARLGAREVGLLQTTGRWPGDALAMVLAAHVTLEGGLRGPFYGLAALRPNARVTLQTQDGRLWHYHIIGRRLLQPSDVKAIYHRDGRRLFLLTCATWNQRRQAYAHRLLVGATMDLTAAKWQPRSVRVHSPAGANVQVG
ncbi:MAG: class F sortase [Anaerolineae bacterium]|nr:class F sortase [Candidatus Roseilinea sp.]MDW8449994.1 class F sortase [Anaerolineae bacterium]